MRREEIDTCWEGEARLFPARSEQRSTCSGCFWQPAEHQEETQLGDEAKSRATEQKDGRSPGLG